MSHYTTLAKLRERGACRGRYAYLTARLEGMDDEAAKSEEAQYPRGCGAYRPSSYPDDAPIPLVCILDLSGVNDAIWATRADLGADARRARVRYALACAERVEHLSPAARACNDVTRRWLLGEATDEELRAAAHAAAYADAADAAAAYAARAAAYAADAAVAYADAAAYAAAAAAWAAADAEVAAAYAAAYAEAADVAEREWQAAKFREVYGGGKP